MKIFNEKQIQQIPNFKFQKCLKQELFCAYNTKNAVLRVCFGFLTPKNSICHNFEFLQSQFDYFYLLKFSGITKYFLRVKF